MVDGQVGQMRTIVPNVSESQSRMKWQIQPCSRKAVHAMGQREMTGTKMKRGRQPKGCFVPLNRDCNQKYQHPNGAAGTVDSKALRINRNGV